MKFTEDVIRLCLRLQLQADSSGSVVVQKVPVFTDSEPSIN